MMNGLKNWNDEIPFPNKKDQSTDLCLNMDDPYNTDKFQKYLVQRNQAQENTYCRILFIQNVQKSQIYRGRKYFSGSLGLWVGMESDKMGMRFLFVGMKIF